MGERFNKLRFCIFIILFISLINPASSQTAEEWVETGNAFIISGEYYKAIEAFNKAIAIDPNDKEAWFNKGVVFAELGEHNNAIEAYNKAMPTDPNDKKAWLIGGLVFFELGEYDKAIEAYDKAIAIDPNYKEVWARKGTALTMLGEYDKAIEAFNKATAIDPNYSEAWINKGAAFAVLGEYDKAIATLNKATAIDPNYKDAWYNKGWVFDELGEYDKAIEAYDKAIAIDPNDKGLWFNKGVAFGVLGEHNKAIEAFDKAIAIDPNYAKAWFNKGVVFYELEEYDKANEAYDMAIAIDEAQSIESNNWIIISGAIIFILIGLFALRNKIKNKSKDDVFKNTNVDSSINKWKIVAYVFLTWWILIFFAGVIVYYFNDGIYDKYYVIDTNASLWALFSLILSTILSHKLKKISEFIYGIIVFIAVFIPIIGIPIALAYSGRGYYELEKKAYKNNFETVTTLKEENVNKWKMFCQKCGAELKEDSNFCSSCGVTLQDKIATEDEKRRGVQGTGQKIKVNNWKILAYVIFTWLGIAIIAKILVVLYSQNPVDDLLTVTGGLYGFTSLFLGIFMTYRLKKKIEFVYGFALFFFAPILIDVSLLGGMLIMLMCFANWYDNLERQKLIKKEKGIGET